MKRTSLASNPSCPFFLKTNGMSDFSEIARRNPSGAISIINSFGYEVIDRSNLGRSLDELVAQKGEPALRKIMEIHPDKEIILEFFGDKQDSKKICDCASKMFPLQHYNASGNEMSAAKDNSAIIASQTNLTILVSAGLIVMALLMNNK